MDDEQEVTIESNDVSAQGFAKEVIGDNIEFGPGVALSVTADGSVSLDRSGAVLVRADEDISVTNAGAAAFVAGGDIELTNGGSQVIVAGGDVQMTNGGAQYVIAGDNVTATKSFIAVAIADEITLSEDSKVLLDTPRAIAFGVAFGAVFAFVSLMFKGKKRR